MATTKKLLTGIICWIMLLPGLAHAQETVRVMVLPFDINASEGKDYLRKELPKVIEKFLVQEGAAIVSPAQAKGKGWQKAVRAAGGIRQFGRQHGADHVISGSLTRIGQKISIDAQMISTLTEDAPEVFFIQGQRIENLSGSVKELVQKFSLKLFKKERVVRIDVTGNRRIEADAVKRVIKTQPGDVFLAKSLSEDLKNVYRMGYFDDIKIKAEETPEGKIIIFEVTEKPTIRTVRILDNQVFDDKEIKESLTIKRGAVLNAFEIRNNVKRIESLYKEKNYHNVRVEYKISPLENNQADLEFTVNEGEKVRIKSITFEGNKAFEADELKDLMKTNEKGFWSWITSSGELNQDDLNQDAARLTAFYHNNGYIEARVGEPNVEYKENWIYITIKIDEGLRYKVGDVKITGDLILSETLLLGKLGINKETFYNREVVRSDVLKLTDLYSNGGYAYADISPRIQKHEENQTVDLIYHVTKGKQVYFDRIEISGNTKTRDKVIRRQLTVYEGELYSGTAIKRSVQNLKRLDYFGDIKVNTKEKKEDDKIDLDINVTEKTTGNFSFGGGYSSTENVFAMASVSQRNLFGRGQTLELRGEVGSKTTRFTLSFTEPWLFDIPLSAGIDLYNWDRDYDTYDKDAKGGAVRFGYPVWDYTRFYLTYRYDISDIVNITEDASQDIKDLEGENVTSSIMGTLRYDSRDKAFNPTRGGNHSLSLEYAGLGGDIGFTKVIGEAGQYFPLFWDTVGFLHAKGGYVEQNSNGILPDYEKFYLGGINSLRGYKWRDVSLKDEDGAEIGGEKFIQFNVEYQVPLLKEAGVLGVMFFDAGNVFAKSQSIDLEDIRYTAGGGIRWYSPMGPIRIEYGYILDDVDPDQEKSGRWEFAMGSAF